jgi:hypothetical protein
VSGVAVPPGLASELHAALIQPEVLDRAAAVTRILAPLGPDALDEVQAAYGATLLDTGDVELVLMLDWWAHFDPKAAFEWAHDSRIGWHPSVLTAVVRTWARQDPEAAREAVMRAVEDERLLGAAVVGLIRGWDESGRGGLEDHLTELAARGDASGRAIETFTRGKIAAGTPEVAIEWAEELPEGDAQKNFRRIDAMGRVAELIVESDPALAAEWATRSRGDTSALMLLIRVGARWAQQDGAAAMAWLGGLSPNRDIPTAVQETFRTWYIADPEAASAWIRSAKLEPWLDPAVGTYALHRALEHPDEGLEWARRLGDARRRDQVLAKIGTLWLQHRPGDGPALVEKAGFSPEVREKIEQARNPKRRKTSTGFRPPEPPLLPQPPDAASQ